MHHQLIDACGLAGNRTGNRRQPALRALGGLLVGFIMLSAPLASADWRVSDGSSVNYVSIKNQTIAENNVFTEITGGITDTGSLSLAVDLASVETKVDIRNQRMRDIFFDVANFPNALVSAQLEALDLAQIDAGQAVERRVSLRLSLHGIVATVDAYVRAVVVGDQLLVTTLEPVLIAAGDFGLAEGVSALQKLAGLTGIASAVPVTVNIQFQKD